MSAADASSLSLWSALSLLGLILVIIGVVLEGAEAVVWTFSWFRRKRLSIIWNKLPEPHIPRWAHRLDHFGWVILVIGLALETWGHIRVTDITGRENRRLTAKLDSTTQIAGAAIASASTNELSAKQLEIRLNETKTELANAESRLIEVRNDNLPMDIGDQYSLAMALKPLAGIQVELRSAIDANAQETADWLASVFATAGCPVINRAFVPDIGEKGIVIGYNFHAAPFADDSIDDSSRNAAHLLLRLLIDRNVPAEIIEDRFGARVRGVPTNAIIVAVMKRPSQLDVDYMVATEKEEESGIEAGKILPRIMELQSERFTNSQELATAQEEFNNLCSQYSKLEAEEKESSDQTIKLSKQVEQEDAEKEGTNGMTPGIHMYNSIGAIPPNLVGGPGATNGHIIFHNSSFNAPPLQ